MPRKRRSWKPPKQQSKKTFAINRTDCESAKRWQRSNRYRKCRIHNTIQNSTNTCNDAALFKCALLIVGHLISPDKTWFTNNVAQMQQAPRQNSTPDAAADLIGTHARTPQVICVGGNDERQNVEQDGKQDEHCHVGILGSVASLVLCLTGDFLGLIVNFYIENLFHFFTFPFVWTI